MAPDVLRLPLVLLATLRTVIASQPSSPAPSRWRGRRYSSACCRRLEIQHTSDQQEGQIYVPKVNQILLVALSCWCWCSVLQQAGFGLRDRRDSIDGRGQLPCIFIFWKLWRWPLWISSTVVALFLALELAFFSSNLLKLFDAVTSRCSSASPWSS